MSVLTPLESNPDVLSKYLYKVGVPESWALTDVVGLEPEMLSWLPKPVKAIIFLFPCSEEYEKHRAAEHEKLSAEEQKHPEGLYYMRQLTHNACGSVALIHSIANNKDIELGDGVLKTFLEKTATMTPEERAKALEQDTTFTASHEALAQEGQTQADPNERVNHHFIALVNVGGKLYELDGRKSFPVAHGDTSEDTFVEDAAKVCKEFIARDPNEVRFTVMALAANQN